MDLKWASSDGSGGGFQVTFTHGGLRHKVHSLMSAADAALICTLVAAREAQEGPGSLCLHSVQGDDREDLHVLPDGGRGELAGISYSQLVQRVQACVEEQRSHSDVHAFAGRNLLHAAAFLGDDLLAGLLLAAQPDLASSADEASRTPLYEAARGGHVGVLRLMLQAALPTVSVRTRHGLTAAHAAAKNTHVAALQQLVHAAPWLAGIPTASGRTPLHVAAKKGSPEAVQLLLAVAPSTAIARADSGDTPMHSAARGGSTAAVALLLAAAPGTAAADNNERQTPMHAAAQQGNTAAAQLLLAAAPETAAAPDAAEWTPIHCAAARGHAGVLGLLLAAEPQAACRREVMGMTPLHLAAEEGHVETVSLLLAAGPECAGAEDVEGEIPLDLALQPQPGDSMVPLPPHLEIARCLLSAGPALPALDSLYAAWDADVPGAVPLFADFVMARLPLTEEVWEEMPQPCVGLGHALPAALAHSCAQARRLVAHLPLEDVSRLRTAALCLARVQERMETGLPLPLLHRILALTLD